MNQPVDRERLAARAANAGGRARYGNQKTLVRRCGSAILRLMARLLRGVRVRGRAPVVLSAGARCVTGRFRESNQDRCYVDRRNGLFLVADGMGGHTFGERASQAVIEVMAERLSGYCHDPTVALDWIDLELQQAVRAANHELMELARRQPELNGIGTTIVAAVIRGRRLLLAAVGDSRAYLLRDGVARQLTRDDTVAQSLLSAGTLTPQEATHHPMRHVIMHNVGTRRLQKDLRVHRYPIRPGDRLLLATDGFTDAVASDELAPLLNSYDAPQETANALVEYAIQAGSRDNITCVVIDASAAR